MTGQGQSWRIRPVPGIRGAMSEGIRWEGSWQPPLLLPVWIRLFPLDGVILCAAYPAVRLEEPLRELVLYGSEDGVLNMDALRKADDYAPADHTEYVIRGGNHAQFGDYGIQKGDGEAVISARDQQEEAVEVILQFCK